MSVFERILKEIRPGLILYTLARRKQFRVESVDHDKLVFFVGTKTYIPIPSAIWNNIPRFLKGGGGVYIGAKYGVAENRTLQEFVERHPSRGTQHSSDANYVVVVLEYLKIVEIERYREKNQRVSLIEKKPKLLG